MSGIINGYIPRNSAVHKMNPVLKAIMFVAFVVLVFMPVGFVWQTIVWAAVSGIFFAAKLPARTYWANFKSVVVMFCVLMLINWFTYRDPGYAMLLTTTGAAPLHVGVGFTQVGAYGDQVLSRTLTADNFFNASAAFVGDKGAPLILSVNGERVAGAAYTDLAASVSAQGADLGRYLSDHALTMTRYAGADLVGIDARVADGQVSALVPQFEYAGYAISVRALIMSAFISEKIMVMILLAVILTSTSTSIELSYAIERILSPLKLLKLPVNALAMTISVAIRFVPSLLLESQRILNAQAARGIDFKNGNAAERAKALVSLIVPMVSIAFRNAADISSAMEARAYNPRYARTRYRAFAIHARDWAAFFLLMLVLGFAIVMVAYRVYFACFGAADWVTVGPGENAGTITAPA